MNEEASLYEEQAEETFFDEKSEEDDGSAWGEDDESAWWEEDESAWWEYDDSAWDSAKVFAFNEYVRTGGWMRD